MGIGQRWVAQGRASWGMTRFFILLEFGLIHCYTFAEIPNLYLTCAHHCVQQQKVSVDKNDTQTGQSQMVKNIQQDTPSGIDKGSI